MNNNSFRKTAKVDGGKVAVNAYPAASLVYLSIGGPLDLGVYFENPKQARRLARILSQAADFAEAKE